MQFDLAREAIFKNFGFFVLVGKKKEEDNTLGK